MYRLLRLLPVIMAFFITISGSPIYENRETELKGEITSFQPGARWFDTDGKVIQAHGGHITVMPVPDENGEMIERYVWVGEDKTNGHHGNCVAMYWSDDLYNWHFGGDVMRSIPDRESLDSDPYFTELYKGCTKEQLDHIYDIVAEDRIIERPKMLYNDKTRKYVIWFHNDYYSDLNEYYYDRGKAGCAVSDSPFGPFKVIDHYRLSECPEGQIDCFPASKGEARDMNLFKDDDGTAYIIYTSENNKTIYISKLNEEYTGLSADPKEAVYKEDYIRIFPGAMREAPVLIKNEGRYYIMTSSTTGWMSNSARVWSCDSIFGDWVNDGNPCKGQSGGITYDTQSTSLFQAPGGQWIYYGDRWNGMELWDSRYVWLPAHFEDQKLVIEWKTEWQY